jgi:DNA invertase Pin-like site-specific DNA recombinase
VRAGDIFIVTKLDRLARSVAHLVEIGTRLEAKGVALKVLDQAIDTTTPSGRLMFNMLGSIVQFERELMLERQREGIAKAKAEGKYKGRKPTARAKGGEVKRSRFEGIGPTAIAAHRSIERRQGLFGAMMAWRGDSWHGRGSHDDRRSLYANAGRSRRQDERFS